MKDYETWEAIKILTESPETTFRQVGDFERGNYIELSNKNGMLVHLNAYKSGQCDSKFIERKWTLTNEKESTTQYEYMVIYSHDRGVGRSQITRPAKINSYSDVEELNEDIKRINNMNCIVTYFKLLRVYNKEEAIKNDNNN